MVACTAIVGRQPVVDTTSTVVGYELLYRPLESSLEALDPSAPVRLGSDDMTTNVLFSALGIGVERLVGGKTIFCNADRGVLTGDVQVGLPPKQTVIEVLESVTIDDDVLRGCRSLKQAGFRLAADDFTYFPGSEALLELVDIVKIDIQALGWDKVTDLIEICQPYDVTLLAEKIETAGELAICQELNFELFQGYHLGRPKTMTGRSLDRSRLHTLQLASEILGDDADFDVVEDIVRGDPALGYQLLQLAAVGRLGEAGRTVGSIRDALVAMGMTRLRGWCATLLLMPGGRATDTQLPTVLARARQVELLAAQLYPAQSAHAFTAGLLSGFDILLGLSRQKLLTLLDVPERLQASAFRGEGVIGALVETVIDFERLSADAPARRESRSWNGHTADGTSYPDCDETTLTRTAAHALRWAIDATELVDTAAHR